MFRKMVLAALFSVFVIGCNGTSNNQSTNLGDNSQDNSTIGDDANASDTDTDASTPTDEPDAVSACAAVVADPTRVRSFCGKSSWVAGAAELCDGTLEYRDYVYDDYGADLGTVSIPFITGPLSPSAGDVTYPLGARNTADLVRFTMALDGDDVVVSYELNTLYTTDQTLAAIAIDTDNDASTGGGELPGLGVSAPGWDFFKTFTKGDPDSNMIIGRFPRPEGDTWRVYALVAKADGTVMNVAFRGINEEAKAGASIKDASALIVVPNVGDFWEDKQAAALKNRDIGAFSQLVCPDEMAAGVSRGVEITPGLHQRVYTSKYTLDKATGKVVPPGQPAGEGVDSIGIPGRSGSQVPVCAQYFNFFGKYQPYGIYLPDQPGPHSFELLLHGCTANHASQINQPGFQADFGEGLNRIIATPLGRGPVGFYSDISERDVLDVYDDMLANEKVDPEQVILGGYSMGGYGALRLGALYPDRWAAVTNWVGFTGRVSHAPGALDGLLFPVGNLITSTGVVGDNIGAVGDVLELVQNLRHIPTISLYGALDELVQVNTGVAMQQAFAANDVEQEFYLHVDAEHLTYMILDSWQRESNFSKDRYRVKHPSRVTYRTDAALDYPEYAIKHDRAYWLRDIKSAAAGYSDLDATIHGCGTPENQYTLTNTVGSGPVPLVWSLQKKAVSGTTPVTLGNRIELSLSNVADVTVDMAGACLNSAPIDYHVESTTPLTLRFSDGRHVDLPAGTADGTL